MVVFHSVLGLKESVPEDPTVSYAKADSHAATELFHRISQYLFSCFHCPSTQMFLKVCLPRTDIQSPAFGLSLAKDRKVVQALAC